MTEQFGTPWSLALKSILRDRLVGDCALSCFDVPLLVFSLLFLLFQNHQMAESGTGTSLRESIKPNVDSRCILDCVKGQQKTDIEHLNALIKSGKSNVNFQGEKKRTPLHEAVLKGETEVVQLLLEAGADIKYRDVGKDTVLHFAVQSGWQHSPEIFKLLLPTREKLKSMTACREGHCRKIQTCRCHTRTKSDCWIDIATSINGRGFNVLDLALEKKNISEEKRNIVLYIVRETDTYCLLKLLRNKTKEFGSPLRRLIKNMPEIVTEVMDKCITRGTGKITFHYELLDDTYLLHTWPPTQDDYCTQLYQSLWEHLPPGDIENCRAYTTSWTKIKRNSPLMLMIKLRRKDTFGHGGYQQLLDHPLVKALIRRKWKHIGIKCHILSLMMYLLYLVIFTACVVTTDPPYMRVQRPNIVTSQGNTTTCNITTICQTMITCEKKGTCTNSTSCHDTTTCSNKTTSENSNDAIPCDSYENNSPPMVVDWQYLVVFLSIILILKEVYEIVRMYGLRYFKQKENYMKWTIYILSILFVVNVTVCEKTDYRTRWQWVLGTFAVFLAWINLLTFAKKFDGLGIYVTMLWTITKTFLLSVSPIVIVLLIAFALAFHCMRQNQDEFDNFLDSLLTTTSLMISGFEYSDFRTLLNQNDVAIVSYTIYSVFLVLMTVIIINLMVGIAVENVQDIHKEACDINCVLQIEHILELEGLMCYLITKLNNFGCIKRFKRWFILPPNEEVWIRHLKSTGLPVEQLLDLTKFDEENKEQTPIQEEMKRIEAKLDELTSIKDELFNIKELIKLQNNKMNNVES